MKRCLLLLTCLMTVLPLAAQKGEYLSPDGKYLLTFNEEDKQYYMHDNRMDYTYCVTCDDVDDNFDDGIIPVWREDSRYVYLSGRYDIWQIDITRAMAPLKISMKRRKAPVKYFLILNGNTLPVDRTVYMKTLDTVTGESGRATFFQRGYKYRFRTYKDK